MKRSGTGNLGAILEAVWRYQGISRITLSARLAIDKSTVSNLVADLLGRGLLEEYDQDSASSSGGRRPVKLRLVQDFGTVVGLEVHPDFSRVTVLDLRGNPLLSEQTPAAASGGFEDQVADLAAHLRRNHPHLWTRCLGLGVAVSGVVDPVEGIIVDSTTLGLRGVGVLPRLEKALGVPVSLENDANAACWGEVASQPALPGSEPSFLFCLVVFHDQAGAGVPVGASVGLGIVLGGRIHYGDAFAAGEFRSLGWRPGNTFQFSLDDAEMAALRTDRGLRRRFAQELAAHLVLLCRVLNLRHLRLGGEVGLLREDLLEAIGEDAPCRVEFARHGDDAVSFGAACLALTHYFRDTVR